MEHYRMLWNVMECYGMKWNIVECYGVFGRLWKVLEVKEYSGSFP